MAGSCAAKFVHIIALPCGEKCPTSVSSFSAGESIFSKIFQCYTNAFQLEALPNAFDSRDSIYRNDSGVVWDYSWTITGDWNRFNISQNRVEWK